MNDISKLLYKPIGLCFSDGEFGQQVHKCWNQSYQQKNSLWLDLHSESDAECCARKIFDELNTSSEFDVSDQLLFISFVDVTKSDFQAISSKTVSLLQSRAGTLQMPLHLEVAHTGKLAFCDFELIRKNLLCLAEENHRGSKLLKQAILLEGTPALGKSNSIEAVFAFLELLRRSDLAMQAVEPNHISFLRYGVFNAADKRALDEEEEHINLQLSSVERGNLAAQLNDRLKLLEEKFVNEIKIEGSLQPIPFKTEVKTSIVKCRLFRKKTAPDAQRETTTVCMEALIQAVNSTALRMKEKVKALPFCDVTKEDAIQWLTQSDAGLKVKQNHDEIKDIIEGKYPEPQHISAFSTDAETPDRIAESVENYLNRQMQAAIQEQQVLYLQNMFKAYREIDLDIFKAEELKLKQRIEEIHDRKKLIGSLDDLCEKVKNSHGNNGLAASFLPERPEGTTNDFLLCAESKVAESAEKNFDGQKIFCIPEESAFPLSKTIPTVQGLQLLSLHCDNDSIADLIR